MFGIDLPACAYPLLLALLGGSAASGNLWGFATLFVFSSPSLFPLFPWPSPSGRQDLRMPHAFSLNGVTPYVIGITLIVISAYVLYTATSYFDIRGP